MRQLDTSSLELALLDMLVQALKLFSGIEALLRVWKLQMPLLDMLVQVLKLLDCTEALHRFLKLQKD